MKLLPIYWVFVVLQLGLFHSLSTGQECDYRKWTRPIGDYLSSIQNIRSTELCCEECEKVESCTAYRHQKISMECQLYNYQGFEDELDGNVVSGIKFPPGYVSEVTMTTTTTPAPCPWNYTGGELVWPHPGDCSKRLYCLEGMYLEYPCPFNWLFDFYDNDCKACESARCMPGLVKPSCIPTTTTQRTTFFPNSTAGPEDCPETGYAKLPHHYDCTKYIVCQDGNRTEANCPAGQHFDVDSLSCNLPEFARCYTTGPGASSTTTSMPSTSTGISTTTSRTTMLPNSTAGPDQCPEVGYAKLPHPYDCTKYRVCEDGIQAELNCPAGQHFDMNSLSCNLPEFANCYSTGTLVPSTASAMTSTTTVGTTTTSSQTTTTTTTSAVTTTTPTTTATPVTTQTTISTTVNPYICPPSGSAKLPFKGDCNKFIQCTNGEREERSCMAGQHFNANAKSCDLPEFANCTES